MSTKSVGSVKVGYKKGKTAKIEYETQFRPIIYHFEYLLMRLLQILDTKDRKISVRAEEAGAIWLSKALLLAAVTL